MKCDKCMLPKLVERVYTRVSQPSTKYFCLIYVMSGWLVKHYTISIISDIFTGSAYNQLFRVILTKTLPYRRCSVLGSVQVLYKRVWGEGVGG